MGQPNMEEIHNFLVGLHLVGNYTVELIDPRHVIIRLSLGVDILDYSLSIHTTSMDVQYDA